MTVFLPDNHGTQTKTFIFFSRLVWFLFCIICLRYGYVHVYAWIYVDMMFVWLYLVSIYVIFLCGHIYNVYTWRHAYLVLEYNSVVESTMQVLRKAMFGIQYSWLHAYLVLEYSLVVESTMQVLRKAMSGIWILLLFILI